MRNLYFSNGIQGEQSLYEDLIVESISICGIDVYYIPRTIVERDLLLNEDIESKFENAIPLVIYVENPEGFQGESPLMSKFGLELRDQATFIVAQRTWTKYVGNQGVSIKSKQPSEGDLIYFPLTKSLFEIKLVNDRNPFFQLKDLNIFRMEVELFEYSSEELNTGIEEIDDIEEELAASVILDVNFSTTDASFYTVDSGVITADSGVLVNAGFTFQEGETVRQLVDRDTAGDPIYIYGTLSELTDNKFKIFDIKSTDGRIPEFEITDGINYFNIIGDTSGASTPINGIEDYFDNDEGAQNDIIEDYANEILDFSETNPFSE